MFSKIEETNETRVDEGIEHEEIECREESIEIQNVENHNTDTEEMDFEDEETESTETDSEASVGEIEEVEEYSEPNGNDVISDNKKATKTKKRKMLRDSGHAYINGTGKNISAKTMKRNPCLGKKCNNQCCNLFTGNTR